MTSLRSLQIQQHFPHFPLSSFVAAGITTAQDFVCTDDHTLHQASKMSIHAQDIPQIKQHIIQQCAAIMTTAADRLDQEMESQLIISTGCENLDILLGGGLHSGEITELVGSNSSGKTQTCLHIAVTVACFTSMTVTFVDSCNSFSVDRISEIYSYIAAGRPNEATLEETLAKIRYVSTHDAFGLFDCLEDLHQRHQLQEESFYATNKLLIIDSFASIVSPLLGLQAHGHATMMRLARLLKQLAMDFSMVVLTTNFTVNHSGKSNGSGAKRPALGATWSSVPSTQILLDWETYAQQDGSVPEFSQSASKFRVAELRKSPRLACGLCTAFDIDAGGLVCVQYQQP